MAVSKTKKIDILDNLKKSIQEAKSVSFTTNNWLTVEEITNLRKELRKVNSSFTLVKKTLIKIAFKEVYNVEIDNSLLSGQIAVVCSNDDAVAALWKVDEFIKSFKKNPKVTWAWSYFEGTLKNAQETAVIASIPSKDVLLGRLVWSMMSPVSALARFFDAASKKLTEEGKSNLWSSAPAKKAEPKVEEKKEEVKIEAETPAETKVEEAPVEIAEEVKTEETTSEVAEAKSTDEDTKEETVA